MSAKIVSFKGNVTIKTKFILYIIFASIVVITSCKSQEDRLKEKIVPVLTKKALQDSIVSKVDKLIIDSIVTFTELEWTKEKIRRYKFSINLYLTFIKHSEEMVQLLIDRAKLEAKSGKIENETMSLILKDESYKTLPVKARAITLIAIEEDQARIRESRERVQKDSSQLVQLEKKLSEKTIDSKNLRGYIPFYRITGANKEGVEVIDTLKLYLSKELNIMAIQ